LIITVDCGMRAFEAGEWAAEKQIDLVITDHHLPDPERGVPKAFAIINPNRPDCQYPDKNLAGVGVAFKLATELLNVRGLSSKATDLLHIAAIGTVADIMNLSGENRAIVHFGLKGLSETRQPGLRALMDVAGCDKEMTSESIGFRLGPRINAAGRMEVAADVVRLLETDDEAVAAALAAKLDQRNRERQQLQQEITQAAEEMVGDLEKQRFIVVGGEGWHRGVIGLAASRIAERFWRPTLVFSLENGIAHGSGRTVGEIHLLRALESCGDLFEQFGGHAAAAGVKIQVDRIGELRRRLEDYAANFLSDDDFQPRLLIDANVSSASMDLEVVRQLRYFEPFGAGNPKPIFVTRDFIIEREPLVMKDKHLKLKLRGDIGGVFEAVWWDGVSRSFGQTLRPGRRIELAYTPEENIWNGTSRLQLVIEDARTDN
jgi:single-stranded-DNA-specific exonuclease